VPPLEAWEKVFLEDADFMEGVHGKVGCIVCHGGDSSADEKDGAHAEMVVDPSAGNCDTCHSDIAHANDKNLHSTINGFYTHLAARGCDCEECGCAGDERLLTAINNHCSACHTSCGQCHVSRPDSAGGGFVSAHDFKERPSTVESCTACHGSRVDAEYFGRNEGVPGDVHQTTSEGMSCMKCHGNETHGSGELVSDRYSNPDLVRCTDCHQDVLADSNPQHQQHIDDLSCQVCHSVEYKNCYSCHVDQSDKGDCIFSTEPSQMDFKIGLNPLNNSERAYKYVVVRHVPVVPDIFAFYGENLMPGYDNVSTWKYATPHNIQLSTPQNENCNACHGHPELFLTAEDVRPEELEANRDVIVPYNQIPK
jgi:hypothetical protein